MKDISQVFRTGLFWCDLELPLLLDRAFHYTFTVHPDPISGMHCWHQAVYLEQTHLEDRYGDVYVDTEKRKEVYRRWLAMTRPGPQENGLRRPEVFDFDRPYRPDLRMFFIDGSGEV